MRCCIGLRSSFSASFYGFRKFAGSNERGSLNYGGLLVLGRVRNQTISTRALIYWHFLIAGEWRIFKSLTAFSLVSPTGWRS